MFRILQGPSRLIRTYACHNCRKTFENPETGYVLIEHKDGKNSWGKFCPECNKAAVLTNEVMT